MINTRHPSSQEFHHDSEADSHPLEGLCRQHGQCHDGHNANALGNSERLWFDRRLAQWQAKHPGKLTDFKHDLLLTWWQHAADLAGDCDQPDHYPGDSHQLHSHGDRHHDACHCDTLSQGCHENSKDQLLRIEPPIASVGNNQGRFGPLLNWGPPGRGIVPIHVGLLPNGKVFSFGQYSNTPSTIIYDVWDPKEANPDNAHRIISMSHSQYRSFCNAMMLLPNTGELLMSGGSTANDANKGSNHVHLFNYKTNQFTRLPNAQSFKDPRWYPTLTTLPDGRILAQGGRSGTLNDESNPPKPTTTLEIYTRERGWRRLNTTNYDSIFGPNTGNGWYYPRSWIDPDNGHVFGLTWDKMYEIDPEGGTLRNFGTFSTRNRGATSTAVMYQPGKILQIGGGDIDSFNNDTNNQEKPTSKQASIIDINGNTPSVRLTQPMHYQRDWANATVLPDGKVLVTGGGTNNNFNNGEGAVTTAEIWDPTTETWAKVDRAATPRLYHSTALLLPDGRVLTGGGTTTFSNKNLDKRKTVEFYTPPNLLTASGRLAERPEILAAPDTFKWNRPFKVTVGEGQKIKRVTLIGLGAVTHSFDMGQRFIELEFNPSGNELTVQAPKSGNLAPPGYYMLFVHDQNKVYSEAKILHVTAGGAIASVSDPPSLQHNH
jgi:hypothetical protein